jgi:hypothetical protein
MNNAEQQQSEPRVEDLSTPQAQQQPAAPEQDDAVKGGIIIVGGYTGATSLLQSSYAASYQQLYYSR